MNTRTLLSEDHRLKLGRGIQLRFDKTRESWTLMAPERVLVLDEISHEVINECLTSGGSVSTVIDTLTERFDAPRDEIATDVIAMLQDFLDKKMLAVHDPD